MVLIGPFMFETCRLFTLLSDLNPVSATIDWSRSAQTDMKLMFVPSVPPFSGLATISCHRGHHIRMHMYTYRLGSNFVNNY